VTRKLSVSLCVFVRRFNGTYGSDYGMPVALFSLEMASVQLITV
jgi:hypothetical protein